MVGVRKGVVTCVDDIDLIHLPPQLQAQHRVLYQMLGGGYAVLGLEGGC